MEGAIKYRKIKISTLLIFLCPFLLPVEASTPVQYKKTYTVGVVPQFDVTHTYEIWRPILDMLEERTGLLFALRGSSGIPSFEKEFSAGNFDFAYMNPYHVLMSRKKGPGYIPLVRDIEKLLYGVLVVRKDSGIMSVDELEGKRIAFPSANAFGASLLIQVDLEDIFHISYQPEFVLSHSSVYLNVVLGETLAGGGVQKTLDKQDPEIRSALRVLYRTRGVSAHPVVAHPRVPPSIREKVRDALLAMGKTEQGQKYLMEVPIRKIGEASIDDDIPLSMLGVERFYVSE